jgi:hypothetical protein
MTEVDALERPFDRVRRLQEVISRRLRITGSIRNMEQASYASLTQFREVDIACETGCEFREDIQRSSGEVAGNVGKVDMSVDEWVAFEDPASLSEQGLVGQSEGPLMSVCEAAEQRCDDGELRHEHESE